MKINLYVGAILWCSLDGDQFDVAVKVATGLTRKGMAIVFELADGDGSLRYVAPDMRHHPERVVWPAAEKIKRAGSGLPRGRPKSQGQVFKIRLTTAQIAKAEQLGGSVGLGILAALDATE